ncbi:MAG: GntR family transcriptional regulator [Acidimicrobiales bacterium]|nr:GntR family transcriptional regulator [Acidimicrobiales bacterium]
MDAAPDTTTYTASDTDDAAVHGAERPARSRSEEAHRALKRLLLSGEFPIGHRLGEERLGARIGVSRTPVREALARLHAEGLVRRHPEGGYEPVFPDMDRIGELYEVRKALELLAVRRTQGSGGSAGASSHDRDALLALRHDWAAMLEDPAGHADPEFVLVDEDFHVRLALASGNHALAELLGTVNERIRLVRVHDFLAADRIVATVEEHLGIVDALLADDPEGAAGRLEAHIDGSALVASTRAVTALVRMLGRPG